MVGAAAGGDQDPVDIAASDGAGDLSCWIRLLPEEPAEDGGLLEDLGPEAHGAGLPHSSSAVTGR
jgi:hypothetical protein